MTTLMSLIGYVGVMFLLLGYFLLVVGQLKVTDTHHIMLNVLGALFTVVALQTGSTVPLLTTVILWLLISLFGLYKHRITVTE